MIAYIDANRHRFGVEPICRVLPIWSCPAFVDTVVRPRVLLMRAAARR
jgi:hypothetical protein